MARPPPPPDAVAIRALADRRGRLALRVTPNARHPCVEIGAGADGQPLLLVKVIAQPEDGRANDAVIRLLAEALGLPRSALTLVQGRTARQKVIAVEGWESGDG
jgi:hypothetical protein